MWFENDRRIRALLVSIMKYTVVRWYVSHLQGNRYNARTAHAEYDGSIRSGRSSDLTKGLSKDGVPRGLISTTSSLCSLVDGAEGRAYCTSSRLGGSRLQISVDNALFSSIGTSQGPPYEAQQQVASQCNPQPPSMFAKIQQD